MPLLLTVYFAFVVVLYEICVIIW